MPPVYLALRHHWLGGIAPLLLGGIDALGYIYFVSLTCDFIHTLQLEMQVQWIQPSVTFRYLLTVLTFKTKLTS